MRSRRNWQSSSRAPSSSVYGHLMEQRLHCQQWSVTARTVSGPRSSAPSARPASMSRSTASNNSGNEPQYVTHMRHS